MNRGRISISVFLCFLIMMFLVVIGCSSGGGDAPAPSPTYTVTFDSQSATVAASPTSKTVTSPATTIDALPTSPTKDGSTFAGWWTGTNGTGTEFTATTTVATDITVYAKWSATAVTFTQADLVGTWRLNVLKRGSSVNSWMRGRFSFDSSGTASCLSYADSAGGSTCPSPFDLTLKMNTLTGVITQTGANAANVGTDHMTMTSNKNFAAGTATGGTTPNFSYQLAIVQKEVTGTSYIAGDLQGQSFVYHLLETGSTNLWVYGMGTLDATGSMSLTSVTNPFGTSTPGATGTTLSVDGNGVVTGSGGENSFQAGFLSDDKKTLVVTFTNGSSYSLMIVQITGTEFTVGPFAAGISASHLLGTGSSFAGWIRDTVTVAPGGTMTFSDWAASFSPSSAPSGYTGNVTTTSGTLTQTGNPTYHGQVSHDGKFTVSTQTGASSTYWLSVSTK